MSFNIKELFKNQSKILNGDLFKRYNNDLNSFFKKDNEDKYPKKELLNNQYILRNKDNYKIVLTPPVFINLNSYLNNLINEKELILQKITQLINSNENNSENKFNQLKKKFIDILLEIKQIKDIENEYNNELNKNAITIEERIKFKKLEDLKKKKFYSSNFTIESKKKNILTNIFKNNLNIIENKEKVKNICKEHDIEYDKCIKWFEWLKICYQYILLQNKFNKQEDIITNIKNIYKNKIDNFLLKKPEINENKNLFVNIKTNKQNLIGGYNNKVILKKLN